MDATARVFALAHLLWPDGAWDVVLRAVSSRVTAAVHSADAAGDDEPMASVEADDGAGALDALAAKLAGFAIARAHDLLAATGRAAASRVVAGIPANVVEQWSDSLRRASSGVSYVNVVVNEMDRAVADARIIASVERLPDGAL